MRREPRPRLEPKEQMLASMSGATITALTMTPFDVIKGISRYLLRVIILNF